MSKAYCRGLNGMVDFDLKDYLDYTNKQTNKQTTKNKTKQNRINKLFASLPHPHKKYLFDVNGSMATRESTSKALKHD